MTNIYLLLKPDQSLPSGWTLYNVNGYYIRGYSSKNSGVADNSSHIHALTSLTIGSPSDTFNSTPSDNSRASDSHGHTCTDYEDWISYESTVPSYVKLKVIYKTYTAGGSIKCPQNGGGLYEDDAPSGFDDAGYDGYHILITNTSDDGDTDAGGHSHTIEGETDAGDDGSDAAWYYKGTSLVNTNHTHTISYSTSTDNHQYDTRSTNIIWATSEGDFPVNFIAFFDSDPGSEWTIVSNSGGDYYERFPLTDDSSWGDELDYSLHAHSSYNGTTDVTTDLNVLTRILTGAIAAWASPTHTHSVTVSARAGNPGLPAHMNFIFAKFVAYSEGEEGDCEEAGDISISSSNYGNELKMDTDNYGNEVRLRSGCC